MSCPYCKKEVPEDQIIERWDTDPHGNSMCNSCADLLEMQWKMCYNCNEYGMAERMSGLYICVDCGLSVTEEEAREEHRVASSADYLEEK